MDPSQHKRPVTDSRGASVEVRRRGRFWKNLGWVIPAVCILVLRISLCVSAIAGSGGTPGQSTPAEGQASASPIEVKSWATPRSGWLYILDYDGVHDASSVLLYDPQNQALMGLIQGGVDGDMQLSSDGRLLYFVSGTQGALVAIDTENGTVVSAAEVPNRLGTTLEPPIHNMALSMDGRWLYVSKMQFSNPPGHEQAIAAYDTVNRRFLSEQAPLAGCGVAQLVASGSDLSVFALCPESRNVRSIRWIPGGSPAVSSVNLPEGPKFLSSGQPAPRVLRLVSGLFLDPAGGLAIANGDGAIYEARPGASTAWVLSEPEVVDRRFRIGEWPVSSDRSRAFIGSSPLANRSRLTLDQVVIYETQGWRQIAETTTSLPFWNLTLDHGGRRLYALGGPAGSYLLVLGPISYNEKRKISGVGHAPLFAAVAP